MTFVPRQWQIDCHEREREVRNTGADSSFLIEACPGAGKSAMAAMIAKEWLQKGLVDHVVIIAPWKSITGSIANQCNQMELGTKRILFHGSGYQSPPYWEVTVLTTAGGCKPKTVEALREWKARHGFRFGLIVDEIHHNSEAGKWGVYANELGEDAEQVVVMSGTPFRTDKMPIAFVPYRADGEAKPHYQLGYQRGVREGYVRDVTSRWIDGSIDRIDRQTGEREEKPYTALSEKEISQMGDDIFDSRGEAVRTTVEMIHDDLMRIRQDARYTDAAALFVCRPGTSKQANNKRVYQVARRIREITGIDPVVVTHDDRDAEGKINSFRNGDSPYIVAVNMISEGCDIPRIVSVGMLRYTDSAMLIRQIVGRAIRRRNESDDIAAMIYAPRLGKMADELERLYEEGAEGRSLRQPCVKCGCLPCRCVTVCEDCGNTPCDCPRCAGCGKKVFQCVCDRERQFEAVDAVADGSGGRFDKDDVGEPYIRKAQSVMMQNSAFAASNSVFLGHFLQLAGTPIDPVFTTEGSPEQQRRRKIEKVERLVRKLSQLSYQGHERLCWAKEITPRFGVESITEAIAEMATNDCDRAITHLQHEIESEVLS